MRIDRAWAMPSRRTFTIKPIGELLRDVFGGRPVFDPFPYPYAGDALARLRAQPAESVPRLVFDPPYSTRQLKEVYGGLGLAYDTTPRYWAGLHKEIARVMAPGGVCVSFGWNSGGVGRGLGFEIFRILLVAHGGLHNDTICTCERKTQERLM